MKKNNKKAMPKGTDFAKKHDALITSGEAQAFIGWVNAGSECVDKFYGNASAYAKASVNGFVVSQYETTIRQYVGAVVAGIKQHGSKAQLLSAYDKAYASREITALRKFVAGSGQRKKSDKKVKPDTRTLTKRKATSFVTKFVPANKRDEAMKSLGF
jgi:hypothetical protein